MSLPAKITRVEVSAFGVPVGPLTRKAQYNFAYNGEARVSLPQAVEPRQINRGELPLFLAQHLPEGYVRRFVSDMLKREANVDDLYLLALQGKYGIGHLGYESELDSSNESHLSLEELLSWKGEGLFETLLSRYYTRGLAAGVQPKALVPATLSDSARTVTQSEFIVKTASEDYEHLAINEFVCMTAAKNAELNTPNFWLSDDSKTFVIERFDIQDGKKWAVDDFSVLTGQGHKKYDASYEAVLKVCDVFLLPSAEKLSLFKQIVFHCLIGNGDAHLKNFSVMYDETEQPVLTPVYDITHTEIYPLLDGKLALKLLKTKVFPNRNELIRFGKAAEIYQPEKIVEEVADSIQSSINSIDEIKLFNGLKQSLEKSLARGSVVGSKSKPFRQDKKRKHT